MRDTILNFPYNNYRHIYYNKAKTITFVWKKNNYQVVDLFYSFLRKYITSSKKNTSLTK